MHTANTRLGDHSVPLKRRFRRIFLRVEMDNLPPVDLLLLLVPLVLCSEQNGRIPREEISRKNLLTDSSGTTYKSTYAERSCLHRTLRRTSTRLVFRVCTSNHNKTDLHEYLERNTWIQYGAHQRSILSRFGLLFT